MEGVGYYPRGSSPFDCLNGDDSTAGGILMARTTIYRIIINSPYEEPARHWHYDR